MTELYRKKKANLDPVQESGGGFPASSSFPEIDESAYEQIREQANRLYRKAHRGYRGQQVTIHDTIDYWVMFATREFLKS